MVVHSADAALAAAGDVEEIAVIGGGEVYKMFLPIADRIYRTDVDLDVTGDTLFAPLSLAEWTETKSEVYSQGPHDSAGFTLRVFDRKKVYSSAT